MVFRTAKMQLQKGAFFACYQTTFTAAFSVSAAASSYLSKNG